jgi:hypothetical protein
MTPDTEILGKAVGNGLPSKFAARRRTGCKRGPACLESDLGLTQTRRLKTKAPSDVRDDLGQGAPVLTDDKAASTCVRTRDLWAEGDAFANGRKATFLIFSRNKRMQIGIDGSPTHQR